MFDKIERHGDPAHYPPQDHICHYKQISVNESLVIPCVKPEIEQLLEVIAHPYIDECTMIQTPVGKKLVIKGHIEQKIVYVADIPCQSVHAAHFTIPFCAFEEVPSTCTWSNCEIANPGVIIEYLNAHKTGPKEIAKCVILFVWWYKKGHHPHPCPPHPHPYPPHPCPPPHPPCPPPHPPCPPQPPCPPPVPPCPPPVPCPSHSHGPYYLPGCQNCKLFHSCYLAQGR